MKTINNADADKTHKKMYLNYGDLFNNFKHVSNSNEYVYNCNFNLEFNEYDAPCMPNIEPLDDEITAKEIADTILPKR